MRDNIFYTICFGFIFGVLVRSFFIIGGVSPTAVVFYITILFCLIAFSLFMFFTIISKNKWGTIVSIFVFAFSFGVFRFHVFDKPAPNFFENQVNNKVSLSGNVVDEPSIGENSQKLIISSSPKTVLRESKTRILISTRLDTNYKYGDEISFSGKLQKPENFITDQGKEFDYINYLKKDGVFYVINFPKIEIISRNNGNIVKSYLFLVKEKFLEKMNLAIPGPENLFMGGLILGEKSSFSQALRQSFVDTGTIHIVALSGYNVTIVAEWFMKLFSAIFSFWPKNIGIGAGIFAVLLFILMTGGSSTAVRAGIMATLALIARATGRNYDVGRALILTGVLMTFFNPLILVYDVSFQLSFIATVAVIFFAPRIEKYFIWVPEKFKLRDIVSVTCATYIFVMPFILYKMGNLSLVALPANILILPFIPLTMLLGFLTGILGLILYVFSAPFGYLSYLFLHYELGITAFFSHLPLAAFTVPDFPLLLTIFIYIYFTYYLFGRSLKSFLVNDF